MNYGYHLAKAEARGAPIVETPGPEYGRAIDLVLSLLAQDYYAADEGIYAEQQRGAARYEIINHLLSVQAYIEGVVNVLESIVWVDHPHHLVRHVPVIGEPYYDVVDGEGPLTPEGADELEAVQDKIARRQYEVILTTPPEEKPGHDEAPSKNNPSRRSKAGPSIKVNHSTGELEEVNESA